MGRSARNAEGSGCLLVQLDHIMQESPVDTQQLEDTIPHGDPFALFDAWFAEARTTEINDSNAMALATASADGMPSQRMVLLKGHGREFGDHGGFVFYTNARSRKGRELLANPQASLLFHWKSLRRQIRIEGSLLPVSEAMADEYFASRARDSQIGAIASDQSAPLASRSEFLARYTAVEAQFAGGAVERPAHWTGFCLNPRAFEFWQDRPFRLHERRRFEYAPCREPAEPGDWTSTLLFP